MNTTGVRSVWSVPTNRGSTPNPCSAARTYAPNPSLPTLVMTAERCPNRAAPTATFVALPPRNLANVRISARGIPDCSGYRSTPTRPIVRTSKTSPTSAVRAVALGVLRRERGRRRAGLLRELLDGAFELRIVGRRALQLVRQVLEL